MGQLVREQRDSVWPFQLAQVGIVEDHATKAGDTRQRGSRVASERRFVAVGLERLLERVLVVVEIQRGLNRRQTQIAFQDFRNRGNRAFVTVDPRAYAD
jgi:hypothetical protein